MVIPIDEQAASIVVLGHFNPSIFHPAWLAAHGLIGEREAEQSKIDFATDAASVFHTDWLQMNIVLNRLQASTTQEAYYEALRDILIGSLELLKHTPITALGLNREFHYRLESEKALHAVGDLLAPKASWNMLTKPGMRSLTMQGVRTDGRDGYEMVRVEPSTRVPQGIYVNINDHFNLSNNKTIGAEDALTVLKACWKESDNRARNIANRIAELGKGHNQ